jgi:purine-binding chemotaxis protein CheW
MERESWPRRAITVSFGPRIRRVVDLVKIRRKAKEERAKELAGEPREADEASDGERVPGGGTPAGLVLDGPTSAPSIAVTSAPSDGPDGSPGAEGGGRGGGTGSSMPPFRTTADAVARLEAFKERVGRGGDVEVDPDVATEQKEGELELLTFLVADEVFAIDIEKIVEIVTPRMPTRVPNAEPGILGIISLRGTIVTVVDVGRRLRHPAVELTASARMIVVAREGETAAFTVDRVLRVVSFSPHDLEFAPAVGGGEYHDYIMGVFRQESALTILLDIDKVLSA